LRKGAAERSDAAFISTLANEGRRVPPHCGGIADADGLPYPCRDTELVSPAAVMGQRMHPNELPMRLKWCDKLG
jgi:hypothetical protein